MAKRTFENALTKLDRITAELEQGDLGLENSLKKFEQAGAQIRKLVADYPEDADVAILLGTFYLRQEKQNEAEAAYLKAVEINPQEIKPYMALANFYETVGNRQKTLASYQKAKELEPENDQIRLAIARYYLAQRAVEDAEKQVAEIVKYQQVEQDMKKAHVKKPIRDQGPGPDPAAGPKNPHREAQSNHRERTARGARRRLPQPAHLRRWGGSQTRDHPRHGRPLDHDRGRQPGGRFCPGG